LKEEELLALFNKHSIDLNNVTSEEAILQLMDYVGKPFRVRETMHWLAKDISPITSCIVDKTLKSKCERIFWIIYSTLNRNFLWALEIGTAQIMARISSPLEPFTRIFPDQWAFFEKRLDSYRGVDIAEGPNGERLYSILVAPFERPLEAHIPGRASATRDCYRWLRAMMLSSPTVRLNTRETLKGEAMKAVPGLSGREFDRAWRQAIDDTGAAAWSQRGRPSKTSRSHENPDTDS
jgi:hypothetical protein